MMQAIDLCQPEKSICSIKARAADPVGQAYHIYVIYIIARTPMQS